MLGFFFGFLSSADFFEINLFQKIFQEYHQSVKNVDPDQARRSVLPDLGTHCLQRLSADGTGRLRVKTVRIHVCVCVCVCACVR